MNFSCGWMRVVFAGGMLCFPGPCIGKCITSLGLASNSPIPPYFRVALANVVLSRRFSALSHELFLVASRPSTSLIPHMTPRTSLHAFCMSRGTQFHFWDEPSTTCARRLRCAVAHSALPRARAPLSGKT